MYPTQDDIIPLQLVIDPLHLCRRRLTGDAKMRNGIIPTQHLLKRIVGNIANGQGCDLTLSQSFQREESRLIFQQGDRLLIQLSHQPCRMWGIQPLRQSLDLDRLIVMQTGYVFITEDLQAFRLDLLQRKHSLLDRPFHRGEVIQGSGRR